MFSGAVVRTARFAAGRKKAGEDQMKNFGRLLRRNLLVLLCTLALTQSALPQDASPKPGTKAEHHVTKEEAQELFRSVDEILKFASDQTGLPILHPVKKKLATREEVARYVDKRLKEQGNGERFERAALPLKKLGLLPRNFDLRQYMLDLYREQVEGWYDTHNKTVYLLDWVAPDEQKPVMAHELVHALQDQNFGLDKWLNIAKDSKDASVQVALEEQRVARQSVVEGQAMVVLTAYEHGTSGSGGQTASSGAEAMSSEAQAEGGSAVYAHAPLYLQEAMLFPYKYGGDFVRFLLEQRGKQAAFAGLFHKPPQDTRQIMQPSTYLSSEPQPQARVVALERLLGPDWRREDLSGIGEIDLRILLEVWGGDKAASLLTEAWHGGYYVSLSKKNAVNGSPISLALILEFTSPEAAHYFGAVYAAALTTRFTSVQPASNDAPLISPAAESPELPRMLRQWMTEEGLVSLYVDGRSVIGLESFAPADAAKLHGALVPEPTITATATLAH
jgi:hypothetical protein